MSSISPTTPEKPTPEKAVSAGPRACSRGRRKRRNSIKSIGEKILAKKEGAASSLPSAEAPVGSAETTLAAISSDILSYILGRGGESPPPLELPPAKKPE